MNGLQKFIDSFNVGPCRRCCIMKCGCCGKRSDIEHKYLGSSWPRVQVAPDPSLIIWKNLGIGKISRCARNVAISGIALFIMILGFYMITFMFDANSSFKE